MNIGMMKVQEQQLLEIIGILAMDEPTEHIVLAKQRLAGMIYGLRIIMDALQKHPMHVTDRADQIHQEFLKGMEQDATWGS